ncbi:MAG: ATP-dependent DNA helicase RecQ [Flavobacteriales bacterium]|nr:MAG: ATP-dependent DNA helicase RecQ [Flavobacteriales bacterium]
MHFEHLNLELKRYFGFTSFKGQQENIIKNLLKGKNSFVIMPTGAGKSMCYQLPSLILDGTSIVVSPLIALMKNQVDFLRGNSLKDSVAHVINSTLTKAEITKVEKDVLTNETKILFVAPESLVKPSLINFLKSVKISFLAIDEAHCISEWGHDFRPDYRNIRKVIDKINHNIPIIALTATATPKVQEDILKNLKIKDAKIFKASFNRPNLYYEVRKKSKDVIVEIVKFIKKNKSKSGIIYCLSRKKVEELTKTLKVNDIKAVPYHAGLDAKTRSLNQDLFLKEDCDIVVATIAFGMGIDKPDVRFVIHHDIPKSLESYYQETGRAGRDGGEGHCLAFYSYKDVEKLENFLSKKTVSERELGTALLNEMVSYAETPISRRKFILHYFGEAFNEEDDLKKMDDNLRFPKNKIDASEALFLLLNVIKKTNEYLKTREIVKIMVGVNNSIINNHRLQNSSFFGKGSNYDKSSWNSLISQASISGYIKKNIENYGVLKLNEKGIQYLKKQTPFSIYLDKKKDDIDENIANSIINDDNLRDILLELRKKVADKNKIPPYTVFQDASINDMTLKYPVNHEEMKNIHGVGEGKAKKYGTEFIKVIEDYVKKNNIMRNEEYTVKSTGSNSTLKLFLIQSIDRKLPLPDIAFAKGMSMDALLSEAETIVYSGTKLNIDYWLDEVFDEDQQEELYEYFLDSKTDDVNVALNEFQGEFDEDEIRLYRLKFLSEVAN